MRAFQWAFATLTDVLRPAFGPIGAVMALAGGFVVTDGSWSWYLVVGGNALVLCWLLEDS